MVIRVFFVSTILFSRITASVKRNVLGEAKSVRVSRGEMEFIQDSDVPASEWFSTINRMASTRGCKYAQLSSDSAIAEELQTLGKFEVEAFEFMLNNSVISRENMVRDLNKHIPPSRTVDNKPLTTARVYTWYRFVLETTTLSLLNGEPVDSLEDFMRTNAAIVTNERGITYIQLSPFGWDNIVYPRLLRSVHRPAASAVWDVIKHGRFPSVKNPHDFKHVPYIIRQFVHANFFNSTSHRLKMISQFDTAGELLATMVEYFTSIQAIITMDLSVFEKFFGKGDYLRCGNKTQLATEWNGLFNATNPPAFNTPYTVERVSFWCTDAEIISRNRLTLLRTYLELHEMGSGHPVSYVALNYTGLEVSVFDALRETFAIPERITTDDVLLAWENRHSYKPTLFATDTPRNFHLNTFSPEHDLPLGPNTIDPFAHISPKLQQSILEDFANDRTDSFTHETESFVDFLKTCSSIHSKIAMELRTVNMRRILTDATEIVNKFQSQSPAEYQHISPLRVYYFYKLLIARLATAPVA